MELEEVVVTAQRREQSLQSTPLAVSVVSGDEISRTGISTFNDVLRKASGITMQTSPQPGGGSGPVVAIRGIGTDGPNKQPGTAIYEDGVSSYWQDYYFYDLARVEVLRGPQGTLYGGTATGGAVNVITNNPNTEDFEGSAQLEGGNYNLRHLTAVVNAPAGDTLAFRLSANHITRDQYSEGGPDAVDALHTRGKVLWEPTENLSLLAGFQYYRDKGLSRDTMQLKPNGEPNGTREVQTGTNDLEVKKFYANVNADLGFANLTYIPALQKASLDRRYTNSVPSSRSFMPDGKYQSHELRLASQADSFVTWVVGGYYYHEDSATTTSIFLPFGQIVVDEKTDTEEVAGFAQATVPLSDSWRVTGGVRVNEDHVRRPQTSVYPPALGIPSEAIPFDKTYHRFDYLARAEHDLTDDNLVYASISTGYRPGGVSTAGQSYTNENVKAFELGSKNTLLDGALTVNGALFYYEYSGFQLANRVSCGTGCLLFDIVSVPAEFKGAELDINYRLTPNDTLSLQPSYLDGYFTADTQARANLGDALNSVPTADQTLPHAPEWTVNGSYQHDFPLSNGSSLFARGEVSYASTQYTDFASCPYVFASNPASPLCDGTPPAPRDTDANHIQRAYTLVNLSTGYTAVDDRWSVTAYVRNLTDKEYKLNLNDPYADVGAPRTYGVVASMRW